jgi:hypothetical protein
MVKNKMAAKTIQKQNTKSVRKMTIRILDGPVFGGSLHLFGCPLFGAKINFYFLVYRTKKDCRGKRIN